MSITAEAIWAAAPSTERGKPAQLSASPDGKRLAYASNKSVFLRSIDNPAASTQYTQHTATTTVARFSPSGYYVASGDRSGTVKVWDCVGEGATKGSYQITRSINDLAWDGESQRIIAVGDGKERFGHCVTADSGNTVGEISGHTAQINSVAIRQQRPFRAATAGDDATTVFYHGVPYKFNTSLRGQHQRFIYGVAFSPDGSTLVSVGADKKIWLYDGKTGEARGQIGDAEHKGSIFAVSWAKDSRHLVTSSADQTVKVWDVESSKCTQSWRLGEEGTVSIPSHQVGVVWPTRSDNTIISLSLSGDLNYLVEGTPRPRQIVRGHQKNITALHVPSRSQTFFTGAANGCIRSWDLTSGAASDLDGSEHTNYVAGFASAPNSHITSVGWDDTLRSIDPNTAAFTGNATPTDGSPRGVASVGEYSVVATHKAIQIFNDRASIVGSLSISNYSPTCISAGESNELIAIGGDDSKLRIYTISSTNKPTLQYESPQQFSNITTLAFDPSTKLLAAGFANGKILVYETSGWEEKITRWSAHTGRVTAVRWSADGKFAVSGALDTNVYVWSVDKPGSRVCAVGAHKEGVNAVGWLGDSKVVSAGTDAAVKVWSFTR